MNVFEKEKKKRLCPFSFVKAKTKARKKVFSCESAAEPPSRGKCYFLQPRRMATRNEEHERKSDTSENRGGGGGYSQKNWIGVCGPLPKTPTLVMT